MKEFKCDKCGKEFGSKDALGMHNKSKHPELYKEPKLSSKQKRKIRNYVILILIIVAIGGFIYWKIVPPKDAPIIEVTPPNLNFGIVSQSKGVVDGVVTVMNKGTKDLIIDKMDTSCGCTSAAIVYKGEEGPRFSMSMHGTNPTDWQLVIPPGESAELKVYYDPNVHRDLRGGVTRSVSIFSNDPRQSNKEVRVNANQVD